MSVESTAVNEFTAAHEAELRNYFSSAPSPHEAPVQSANENNAHAGTGDSTRTMYRGVYVNTHKNRQEFRYRVAISQWDDTNKKLFWINLGYFNDLHTAGLAYNVSAFGIFLAKAKVNRVNPAQCDPVELAALKEKREMRFAIAGLVMDSMFKSGTAINYVN